MVPKLSVPLLVVLLCFRAVLFRMVPKPFNEPRGASDCFRAVLFRMVPKPLSSLLRAVCRFRAVLFRMVPKPSWKFIVLVG